MKKVFLILIVVIGGWWVASSIFGPEAPLEDGLYLSYEYGGATLRVTFSEIDENQFRATLSPGGSEEVVNKRLKTTRGGVYEVGLLGPLWIPPSSVKVGGNAHGDRVVEVKPWRRWDVGVVEASFGAGGALRGKWYYEENTGFLVGGSKWTALSADDEGTEFVLIETNLEGF